MVNDTEWITTPQRFVAIADEWDALADAALTPFGDHAWFRCWMAAFTQGVSLRVVTTWSDGVLTGALALRRRRGQLGALANYHSPFFGPLARDDRSRREVIASTLDAPAIELRLAPLLAEDPAVRDLAELGAARHRRVLLEQSHTSPFVETSGGLDAYERSRRSSLRTLLRRRRKLGREHRVRFAVDEAPTDLDSALRVGFEVEASGWKRRTGTAILSSPATLAFYRDIAHAYAARGELRLVWLHVDDKPAAFSLCLERARRIYLLKTGFDEALAHVTPGLVQHLDLIEWCFETGRETYELLGVAEPWKLQFATGARRCVRGFSYRRDPVSLTGYAGRRFGVPLVRRGRSAIAARARTRESRPPA
jgi:CelD/BcsL family acetyltransferase involved in cellulose biosynthesis